MPVIIGQVLTGSYIYTLETYIDSKVIGMSLYHKDTGFPANIALPAGEFNHLICSDHAKDASWSDRYGFFKLPSSITVKPEEIFEIEVENNRIIKFCCRKPVTANVDMSFAIIPDRQFVKTIWLNSKKDSHKTLHKHRYSS